jgi:hypothetical protein
LAPVSPFNTARMASRVLADGVGKRIAVVMRPCEVRALIELAKLSQCTLEPAILISMDCFGRMENDDYLELAMPTGKSNPACRRLRWTARRFAPVAGPVRGLFRKMSTWFRPGGGDGPAGVLLASGSDKGETLLKSLARSIRRIAPGRREAVARIMAERQGGSQDATDRGRGPAYRRHGRLPTDHRQLPQLLQLPKGLPGVLLQGVCFFNRRLCPSAGDSHGASRKKGCGQNPYGHHHVSLDPYGPHGPCLRRLRPMFERLPQPTSPWRTCLSPSRKRFRIITATSPGRIPVGPGRS